VKLLAVDTSSEHCSAALFVDGEIDSRDTPAGQNHSSVLLRMIDELLRARRVPLRALDAIAFGEGPGSFTGLRITCGVVQGLAFGGDVPVVGIGTLLAMAEGSGADRVVCCVDARIHEIYHAAYTRVNGILEAVCPPSLCAPAAAPDLEGAGWVGCGSGFIAYADALAARYGGQLASTEPGRYPHARDIAALAVPRVERGAVASAEAAAPLYLRNKVALRTDERPSR
jgi:tRNA threonylcarbamoyladenosine biosynthesis protein TsaB